MIELAKRLYPIARSLTGPGVEQTLQIIGEFLPQLEVHSIPSGAEVYGWTVPRVWTIRDAWIETPAGERICRFTDHPLHLVGYSVPVDLTLDLAELQTHLHSLPDLPEAIPYVTAYYSRKWGFCLSDRLRQTLKQGRYRVFIDSSLDSGSLIYGEHVLPGQTKQEIVFSTNICHPYMAENETSGMVVVAELAKRLRARSSRFTYRFLFTPETIGAISYKHKRRDDWQNIVAGCHVYCVGRAESPLQFILGPEPELTLADRIARVSRLPTSCWVARGSDERQYCHPPQSWPFVAPTRGTSFREYHTSFDTPILLSAIALEESVNALEQFVEAVELNAIYAPVYPCEPQLSACGLYPDTSLPGAINAVRSTLAVIGACNGVRNLVDVALAANTSVRFAHDILARLAATGQMKRI